MRQIKQRQLTIRRTVHIQLIRINMRTSIRPYQHHSSKVATCLTVDQQIILQRTVRQMQTTMHLIRRMPHLNRVINQQVINRQQQVINNSIQLHRKPATYHNRTAPIQTYQTIINQQRKEIKLLLVLGKERECTYCYRFVLDHSKSRFFEIVLRKCNQQNWCVQKFVSLTHTQKK